MLLVFHLAAKVFLFQTCLINGKVHIIAMFEIGDLTNIVLYVIRRYDSGVSTVLDLICQTPVVCKLSSGYWLKMISQLLGSQISIPIYYL